MVNRALPSAIVLLALAGCASPRASAASEELDRRLAGRTEGEPRACLSPAAGTGLTIVAPGAIGYRSGNTLWVNRPGPPCSGIRPMDTLIVESPDGRYCRGDPVRAVATGTSIAGPACSLGDFIPYRRSG